MTSMNDVLMKFFKLPPAVRMLLAVAGFGSLASIFFTLFPQLRTPQGRMWVLIIGGIGLVLFLIVWGLRRMVFGRKSGQLSSALESQGPTRGEIAEQEQLYREKFLGKLNELKQHGLSVYKLPWFMLMGEPGCGKTASLIHSGLDFPLGKDEVPGFGGTRNYNWWFTNEAVILDTAGRIAFHEEGSTDKVEWEYFCKMLKRYRPRCPINGLVVALPADKLLRDSPDERAEKAAILRERLRQVHQILGVRFPTFILVTKMDLVAGFSEFFEEIRVDLAQRNQMFGWSRPGEFQETYEPDTFESAFRTVYQRIRDWSMRYLQRKATDEELGMVVTYPEAFRQLGPALKDYVGTIFQKSPLLEPPFFRGFYFTSAVQEGAPILDVFRKASGHSVADRPARAVDSKAFFIHDLYTNKVFPEQGLVFRSAKHVSLDKRKRSLVWYGSAAMVAMMLAFFGFGYAGTSGLITRPKEDCKHAHEAVLKADEPYDAQKFQGNLRLAKQLRDHYDSYEGKGWYARLLFIGANIREPQGAVGTIHARFVLDTIIKPVIQSSAAKLATVEDIGVPGQTDGARQRYLEALRVLTQWYGEVVGQERLPALDGQEARQRSGEFRALLNFLEVAEPEALEADKQIETALTFLASTPRSFARDVLGETLDLQKPNPRQQLTDQLVGGVNRLRDNWLPFTQISSDSNDARIQYWSEFARHAGELRKRYQEALDQYREFTSLDGYSDARARYLALTEGVERIGELDFPAAAGSIKEAYDNFIRFLSEREPPQINGRIVRLNELFSVFESQWQKEFKPLEDALARGAPNDAVQPQASVYQALRGGQDTLAGAFRRSLDDMRVALGLERGAEPLDAYVAESLIVVNEAQPPAPFDGKATIRLIDNPFGARRRAQVCMIELRDMLAGGGDEDALLADLAKWPQLLGESAATEPPGEYFRAWFSLVKAENVGLEAPGVIEEKSEFRNRPFWKPFELYRLADSVWKAQQKRITEGLLGRMEQAALATVNEPRLPGLARLMPGYADADARLPFKRHRFNAAAIPPITQTPPAQPDPEPEPEDTAAEPADDETGVSRPRRPRRPGVSTPEEEPAVASEETPGRTPPGRSPRAAEPPSEALLAKYHTRDVLVRTLRAKLAAQKLLAQRGPAGRKVIEALDRATQRYVDTFFEDWYTIYSDPTRLLDENTLSLLELGRDGKLTWPDYVDRVAGPSSNLAGPMATAMQALLREAVLFWMALEDSEADDAVWGIIDDRLTALQQRGRSVPDALDLRTEAAINRKIPQSDRQPPEAVFAGQLVSAWDAYITQVRGLGALREADARSSGSPPDVRALESNVIYQQSLTTEFPTIRPLLDLAGYGERLLVHHMETKFSQAFGAYAGRYPMLNPGDALDPSIGLSRLASMQTVTPSTFLGLLKTAVDFRSKYADLLAKVSPDSNAKLTLDACDAWATFLFGNPAGAASGQPPQPQPVSVAIYQPSGGEFLNAASVYQTVTIQLPLLQGAQPAPPLKFDTRTQGDLPRTPNDALTRAQTYQWFLSDSAQYPPSTAFVSDANERSRGTYPERVDAAFNLPGSPWTLLMMMGSSSAGNIGGGTWSIPIVMQPAGRTERIGFFVAVRLGDGARTYPGPIPPPRPAGPIPVMTEAQRYLQGTRR